LHRAKVNNTALVNAAKKSRDATEIAAVESDAGSPPFVRANTWNVPNKNGRVALCMVAVFHLAVIWSLQSGLMRQVRQVDPLKNVLMTYVAPANFVSKPARKSILKTVTVTTPVMNTPTVMPVAPVVEHAIETANKPLQLAAQQTIEAITFSAPLNAPIPKTIVTGVDYIQAPQPVYPPLAKRAGEQGKVLLRVLVSDKGLPESVDLQKSSGSVRLDEAAKQAVLRARFKPYLEDGKALAVYVIVPITFQLDR
jgi:protein TonB